MIPLGRIPLAAFVLLLTLLGAWLLLRLRADWVRARGDWYARDPEPWGDR